MTESRWKIMTNENMPATATEKVQSLSDSLTNGLRLGEKYVALLNQLCSKNDPQDLLDATQKLEQIDLTNAFVKFPQHYHPEDYYLLLMGRLLDLNGVTGTAVEEDARDHRLSLLIDQLGSQLTFRFELDVGNGGAFFAEQEKHEPLFYINLEKRAIRFSNRALVNFYIVRLIDQKTDLDIEASLKPIVQFTELMAKNLDFSLDWGILDTNNDAEFRIQAPELDTTVIDKLFVKTADTDYMLLSLEHNNGAELQLDQGVKLMIGYDPDDYSKQWKYQVKDEDNKLSFFDVLLHYDLIRTWYLDDRETLAVRSDPLIFAD